MCDWWECSHFKECSERSLVSGRKYPPCACCVHFDKCDYCQNYIDCADVVRTYLPDMFRRLVREIRTGEDSAKLDYYNQLIRRNTLGGRKRK